MYSLLMNSTDDKSMYKLKRKRYKAIKRKVARAFYAATFGLGLVLFVFAILGTFNESHLKSADSFGVTHKGRRLSGGGGCDFDSWLLKGTQDSEAFWGSFYFLITLYWFIGIAIVCDYFFEPALGEISDALNLSPDVAGATFMAAGSSAPELFTSMADTFTTSNNIGIGTIVGSAMFNILIIVAAAAMAAGKELFIDWRCIARDVGFYSLSVLLLVGFFWDDKAEYCMFFIINFKFICFS